MAYVLGVLAMAQLYVVGFLAGTLSVIFDLSWNTLFVAVTKRDRYIEAMALLNGSRSLASVAGPTDRRPPGPGPRRAAGDARRRDLVPRLGRLPAPDQVARTADRARGRLDPRTAAGRACPSWSATRSCARPSSRWRRSTCSPSLRARCSSCTRRRPSASRRACSAWRSGSGRSAAVIGAVFASRIGRRIGLGPGLRAGLPDLPGAADPHPAGRARTCRCRSSWPCSSARSSAPGFGVMILDINVGAIIYARTPDRIRARAAGAFRFINYGVRPIGALLGGLLGAAHRRARGDVGRRRSRRSLGVLFLVGSPVLRLRDLPEVSADRRCVAPARPGRPGPDPSDRGRRRRCFDLTGL